jgi:hypothetical protein
VTHETGDVQVIATQAAKHWWLAQDSSPDTEVPESLVVAFVQALSDYALTAQPSEVERSEELDDPSELDDLQDGAAQLEADYVAAVNVSNEMGRELNVLRPEVERLEAELGEVARQRDAYRARALNLRRRLTAQPAPSGWQQRIAAMEPCNEDGDCRFCDGEMSHKPDCLWQNAVDALPPAPDAKDDDAAADEALIDKGWEQLKAADIAAKGSPRDIARGALDPFRAVVDAKDGDA